MKRSMLFLLYTAILLLPLGQIVQISLRPDVHLYPIDIVVFLLACAMVFVRLLNKIPVVTPPLTPYIVMFASIGIVSLLFSFFQFNFIQVGTGSLYLLRWTCYSSVYFIAYQYENKKHLLYALGLSGTICGIIGLTQYFFYPNLRNLGYLGWDPHEYRVFGTLFDSGFAGIIYVLTLLLLVYLWREFKHKIWLVLAGILTYAAFALTYARSSYLAFVAAFFILSILKKTYKYTLWAVVILGTTILLLPRPSETSEGVKLERTASISARGTNYLQTLEIVKDNPLIGIGFNTMRYENAKRGNVPAEEQQTNNAGAGSDSSLLFVAATTGILGLLVYSLLWIQMVRIELKKEEAERSHLLILPTLGALLVNSLFLNSLFYIWVMLWVWILLGVSHGTSNRIFVSSPVPRNNLKSIFTLRQIKH